ncbi:protein amalgam-like [Oculina patagonica]
MIAMSPLCSFLLILLQGSVFNKVHGLRFVTEQNETTIASTGSNQTFTWKLSLTEQEKTKHLQVQFGPWDKEIDAAKHYWIVVVQEPSRNQTLLRGNNLITKRLYWAGDLAHDYVVVFKLFSAKPNDSGDYGIRDRVNGFPQKTLQSWFTLSVQDLPPLPTKLPTTQNVSLDVEEGDELNITCHIRMETNSSVLWIRDSIPLQKGKSRFLYIRSVNRSQEGNYICVSLSSNGNFSSPITTVNVLYAPSINFPSKQVTVEILRGNSTTLKCVAAANPSPTFTWHKHREKISVGFNSTWNSTTLTVTPVNDNDLTSYVCTAKNPVGWDSVTFILREKVNEPTGDSKNTSGNHSTVTETTGESKATPGTHSTDPIMKDVQQRDRLGVGLGIGLPTGFALGIIMTVLCMYVCYYRRKRRENYHAANLEALCESDDRDGL